MRAKLIKLQITAKVFSPFLMDSTIILIFRHGRQNIFCQYVNNFITLS